MGHLLVLQHGCGQIRTRDGDKGIQLRGELNAVAFALGRYDPAGADVEADGGFTLSHFVPFLPPRDGDRSRGTVPGAAAGTGARRGRTAPPTDALVPQPIRYPAMAARPKLSQAERQPE